MVFLNCLIFSWCVGAGSSPFLTGGGALLLLRWGALFPFFLIRLVRGVKHAGWCGGTNAFGHPDAADGKVFFEREVKEKNKEEKVMGYLLTLVLLGLSARSIALGCSLGQGGGGVQAPCDELHGDCHVR